MWNKGSYEESSCDLWILQWNCFATKSEILFCHKKGSESHLFLDGCEFRRLEVVVSRGHVGVAATHDRKKVKEMSPQNPPSSRSSHYWWLHGTNGLSTIQTWHREPSVEQLREGSSDGQKCRSLPEITLVTASLMRNQSSYQRWEQISAAFTL